MRRATLFMGAVLLAAPASDSLYDAARMRDRAGLDLKLSVPVDYTGVLAPDRKLKRIDLSFTSFEWAGEKWRHPAILLLPDRAAPEYRGAGVIVAGNGSNPKSAALRYAEAAALMGIPALAIAGANPGPHYGVKMEGPLMSYMERKFMETGDASWIGYSSLAKVIVRAVTAMQAAPGVEATRFVVTGGSKRGAACWIAMAADRRIVGAYPGAWNMANFEASLRLRAERLGAGHGGGEGGPSSKSSGERLSGLASARGKEYRRYLDPYLWRDRLTDKKALFTAGTNDPLFHPLSDSVFLPGMPKSTRILLVPNYGHGYDGERQSAAWRMWLAHVFAGRPVPEIALDWKRTGVAVELSARVVSNSKVTAVTAWSASDERGGYLEAKWSATPLAATGGAYRGTLVAPSGRYTAFFVEVEDEDPRSGKGVLTSGMQECEP